MRPDSELYAVVAATAWADGRRSEGDRDCVRRVVGRVFRVVMLQSREGSFAVEVILSRFTPPIGENCLDRRRSLAVIGAWFSARLEQQSRHPRMIVAGVAVQGTMTAPAEGRPTMMRVPDFEERASGGVPQ